MVSLTVCIFSLPPKKNVHFIYIMVTRCQCHEYLARRSHYFQITATFLVSEFSSFDIAVNIDDVHSGLFSITDFKSFLTCSPRRKPVAANSLHRVIDV